MKQKPIQIILIGLIAAFLMGLLLLASNGGLLSSWALDHLWRLNGPFKVSIGGQAIGGDQVAVVAIDNKSLRAFRAKDSQRISRKVYADLINKLSAMGARSIGFDVTFDRPGSKLEDTALEIAVKKYGRVVTNCYLKNDKLFENLWIDGRSFFRDSAISEGIADLPLDSDNYIRRVRLYAPKGELSCRVAFCLSMYLADIQASPSQVVYSKNSIKIPRPGVLPPMDLPLSYNGQSLIGFLGGPQSLPTYSALDILENKIVKEKIRDKIIVVGGTADEFRDMFHTPFAINGRMPGVEIHAHLIEALLMGKLPREISGPYYWFTLCLFASIIAILTGTLGPMRLLPFMVIIAIGWLPIVLWLFVSHGVFINMFDVWACLVLSWISATAIRSYFLQSEKQAISNLFHQYVSPNLLQELLDNPDAIALGGARKEAVILFADIRGFTGLCEDKPPEEIITFLNMYFDAVTKEIFSHGGVLDKYIGDGLMAFFGVPIFRGNEACQAVEAAVKMQAAVKRLKLTHNDKFPVDKIGIGIHGGMVVVGNVGSERHMEYTLLGDIVNVAARLESLSRNGEILVSKWVYDRLPKVGFNIVSRGELQVKGRKNVVDTYEVRGENRG